MLKRDLSKYLGAFGEADTELTIEGSFLVAKSGTTELRIQLSEIKKDDCLPPAKKTSPCKGPRIGEIWRLNKMLDDPDTSITCVAITETGSWIFFDKISPFYVAGQSLSLPHFLKNYHLE